MIDRRGFFSRLAGVALLPALARFAPEPVRPVLVMPWPLLVRNPRRAMALWHQHLSEPGSVILTDKLRDGLGAQLCGLGPIDVNAPRLPWHNYTATYDPPEFHMQNIEVGPDGRLGQLRQESITEEEQP